MASERSVVVRIRAEIGDFRRQMDQAAAAARRTGEAGQQAGQQASTGLGRLASSARHHEQAWSTAGGSLLTFGAAVGVGVGLAIKKYMEFEKAMSEVSAATHAGVGDMDALREAAMRAGADTAFSAKEAADAITELSKAGVGVKDILNGGLDGALSLAAAGSMDVAKAAELSATAMTQFKLSGSQIPHVADLLAAGAGKAQGSVEDLGMALKQGGLVAASTGLGIEEVTGGLAAFASAGLIGSDAGTSFKTMLQALTPNSKEAKAKMDELGFSAFDADGNFRSLSAIAGDLQTSMQKLTPEARATAMEIIFGSDAVRAANVLYEQGAKGIDEWTNKVNVAGYAAATASIKQDNLAGDLEKLGGSFDTVLIKGGSGAAQALRGIVQGAEDLIDGIGKIDPEIISLVTGMAGIVGVSALVGGGFLTLFPRVMQVHSAFKTLQTTNSGLASGLGKVGKAAGIAGAALAALSIAGAVFTEKSTKSASDYANAILKVANAGKDAKASDLDSIFQGFDKFGGQDTVNGINGVTDAVKALANPTWEKQVDQFFDGFTAGVLNLPKSDLGQMQDRLRGIGDEMGNIVKNGGAEAAAKSFRLLTDEFKANGKSAQDALDTMPGYKDALLEQANALGVNLEPAQLLELAQGRIPGVMQAAMNAAEEKATADTTAAKASEAHAEALAELGLNADGTVASLEKYTQALFNAGLTEMDARSATAAHEAALDAVKGSVEEATAALAKQYEQEGESAEAAKAHAEAQMGLGVALNKNKTDFDLTNAAGRALNDSFQTVASTGMAEIEAKAKAGMGQPELQKTLGTTFESLRQTGIDMGLTGGAADALARKVMGIPPKANINTWMSDEAKRMADATAKAVGDLDGKTAHTYVYHHEINTIENITTSSASVHNNTGGKQGTKPTFHAEGGPVFGPGTGTSDEVPAWLSNGEHVLTAREVLKMGGQQAVYRFRQQLMDGDIPKFATGGHLGESANARANRLYRERQAAIKRRNDELKKSAQFRAEQAADLRLGDARGETYRSVTNLSSGYSFSDKLRSVANSGNIPTQRGVLLQRADWSDQQLRSLSKRADNLSVSLDKAKSKLEELQQVRAGVSSKLAGEFSLAGAVKDASFYSRGSIHGVQKSANATLARLQTFSKRLQSLQKKGYASAVLREVADMGSEEGIKAADILLQANSGDVRNLNNTYAAIGNATNAAGTYVTDAMYKGGVNAAAGLVKGLQSQQAAIEKQMMNIGISMEKALKKSLGIRSPSRKAMAIGSNFTGTLADTMKEGRESIARQAAALGDAMNVVPSKSLAGGYGGYATAPGYQVGMPAAASAASGPVTHIWNITDQSSPVATAHEVARRQQSLAV